MTVGLIGGEINIPCIRVTRSKLGNNLMVHNADSEEVWGKAMVGFEDKYEKLMLDTKRVQEVRIGI